MMKIRCIMQIYSSTTHFLKIKANYINACHNNNYYFIDKFSIDFDATFFLGTSNSNYRCTRQIATCNKIMWHNGNILTTKIKTSKEYTTARDKDNLTWRVRKLAKGYGDVDFDCRFQCSYSSK